MGIVPRHQPGPVERLAEFVHSRVYDSPGLADIREEVFAGRSYPAGAGGFGDVTLNGADAPAAWASPMLNGYWLFLNWYSGAFRYCST